MKQAMRFYADHLPTHGAGPLYSWGFRRGRWGNGVAVSIGGYGWQWRRPRSVNAFIEDVPVVYLFGGFVRFYDHYTNAAHLNIGPVTFSLIYNGSALARVQIMAVRLADALAVRLYGPQCRTCDRRTRDGQCVACAAFYVETYGDEEDAYQERA